jgi:pimeloyl-ACP methyl ester carboxylesterase
MRHQASAGEKPAAAPAQSGFEGRILGAPDGLEIFARDYNPESLRAVTLLCLPGLVRTSRDYHALAERYAARGWRVLCPDYRGRGASARPADWRHYDVPYLLGDLLALLTALEIDRTVAIGTSMGGVLAMALSVMRPGALAGIVLNDIGPEVTPGGAARIVDYVSREWRFEDWPAAIAHLRSLFAHGPCRSDDDWAEMAYGTFILDAEGWLRPHWDPAIGRMLAIQHNDEATSRQLWAAYRTLATRPALAIRGMNSDVLSEETFLKMQANKPDLSVLRVPDVGHTPSLKEPECLAAIDALLARIACE